jgi:hypothetical protein
MERFLGTTGADGTRTQELRDGRSAQKWKSAVIAAAFFGGFIVGAAVLILFALYLSQRDKPEAKPQHGVAVTSVSLTGKGGPSIDAFTARRMNDIFRDYKNGTIQ